MATPLGWRACAAHWLIGSKRWASPSGNQGVVDRYIGYYEPYATSHDALDKDEAIVEETRHVARSIITRVRSLRDGSYVAPDAHLTPPRQK